MCQSCVEWGQVSQWLYDVIGAFCERYAEGDPYYGFGHIVLDDYNVETYHIQWCLNEATREGKLYEAEVESFLKWMLTISDEERHG